MWTWTRALAVLIALIMPAAARELADAPEVRIFGMSPGGRYLAYEQFFHDSVSAQVVAGIDVVDRDTGASVEGFPIGFLPISKDGVYPLKVGTHDLKVDETKPEAEQLATLRRGLRDLTRARLDALGISDDHRRLAGRPVTDRSAATGPVRFVLGATLPGQVPDQQPVYDVATRITPADFKTCTSGAKPADHKIEVVLTERQAAGRKVTGTSKATIAWPHIGDECAQAVAITDVVVPGQPAEGGHKHVAVILLATSWGLHAEGARHLVAFVEIPK